MPLRLQPRHSPSRALRMLAPLYATLACFAMAALILALYGKAPGQALFSLFIEPLTNRYGWGDQLVKAAPLALIAGGLSLAFRARVWNIGAQGQYLVGAICASAWVVYGSTWSAWLLLPAMMLTGAISGALYGLLPGLLKNRFNANEILTSLMLDYIALYLLRFLTFGPWRDPNAFGFPGSVQFPVAAQLPDIWPDLQLDLGVLLSFLLLGVIWAVVRWSLFGYQIRVAASAPAGIYAGFDRRRLVLWVFALSGACAGLAGMLQVSGPIEQLRPQIYSEIGFAAIIVAYLGQLHALAIVPASLLVALFYVGANSAQMDMGLPLSLAQLFQGLLLLCLLGANVLVHHRITYKAATA